MRALWDSIRYHADRRGKTVNDLALHVGMTPDGLRDSIINVARLKDVAAIAAYLDVDLCELITGNTSSYVNDRKNAEALRRLAQASMEYAMTYFEELRKRGKLSPLVVEAADELGLI